MTCLPSTFQQHEHVSSTVQHIKYLDDDCVISSSTSCSVSLCSTEGSSYTTDSPENDCSLNRIEILNEIILNVQIDDIGDADDFDLSYHHNELNPKANNVRFEVDENNSIIEYHYEYPMCDDFDVYTTSDDEKENRRRIAKQTRRFQKLKRGLITRLDKLYEHEAYSKYPTIFNEWCSSELRGFESSLIHESHIQVAKYVEFVVTYYHGLQELLTQRNADIEDDIHELLRDRIVLLSQKSRDFSELLAAADEVESRRQSSEFFYY